jgi:hemolysin activation/secretion protein
VAIEAGAAVANEVEFRAILTPFLAAKLDEALLGKIVQRVVAYTNEHSSLLVDVYFPRQEIADGYLVLVVAPAKVGKVIAKGQQHVEGRELSCRIRLRHGDPVDTRVVADDLAFLNRNPWRRTDVAFTPGAAEGETDVVLTTTDQLPVRVYAATSNGGTRPTGLGRYTVGVNVGNPFNNFDHRLDFSYTQAQSADAFNQATLAYTLPLRNRDTLTGNLSVSQTHAVLEDGLFDARGTNTMASVEWSRPLGIDTVSPEGRYPELYAGVEYKRIGSTLAFGETSLSNVVPEVLQGYLGYRSGWSDAWGRNDIDGRFTYSPGGLVGSNNDEIFEKSRPGARAQYQRLNLSYDRYVALPRQMQFHGRVSAQYSNQTLLASEQFGLSGSSGVRGYYEDTLIADRGIVLNLELQAPYVQVPIGASTGLLQGLVFVDGGRAWRKTEALNADLGKTGTVFDLASFGIGARFNLNPTITLRADLGWRTTGLQGTRGMLAHVFALVAY